MILHSRILYYLVYSSMNILCNKLYVCIIFMYVFLMNKRIFEEIILLSSGHLLDVFAPTGDYHPVK